MDVGGQNVAIVAMALSSDLSPMTPGAHSIPNEINRNARIAASIGRPTLAVVSRQIVPRIAAGDTIDGHDDEDIQQC
jgi:hypothetical protein